VGYEMDDWNLKRDLAANPTNTLLTAGKPSQRWVTVDIQHSFSSTLAVGLEYQMTAYRDKGTGFGGADDADGNVAVCQFQVKF